MILAVWWKLCSKQLKCITGGLNKDSLDSGKAHHALGITQSYQLDYLHFQARVEYSRAIWFVCLSAAEIWLRPRQKWFSKLNSPLPSSLAVASCCRQTTDSRDNRGLHVFRIDIGATSDSSPCIPDWWQTLSAAAECGAVAGEVLTFWIKNEEWEEAGVLTMG